MTRSSSSRVVRAGWCLIAALSLAAWGCASTTEPEPEVEPTPTGSEFDQGSTPAPPPRSSGVVLDLGTVYFDFDKSEIRQDARGVLQKNYSMLPDVEGRITIEGHCDERGDEEYNLALGDRRATAVKRYLVNLGADGSRLRTISYGESRPATTGHDESAWRWNRRAEFTAAR